MPSKLYGNISGLKSGVLKKLESLYKHIIDPNEVVSTFLSKQTIKISKEISRVIALLINRQGKIEYVIVGDNNKVFIPDLGRFRAGGGRFRGLRLFHTKLNYEQITVDDLTDLYKLRLDMVSVLTMTPLGEPDLIYSAVINSDKNGDFKYLDPISIHDTDISYISYITMLEDQFSKEFDSLIKVESINRAIVIYVSDKTENEIENSLDEIYALSKTAGIEVVETFIQKRKIEPKTVVGLGKLDEILLFSNKLNCDLLIFNHTLSPSQIKTLTLYLEEKVIDRNMLILDIFAQHAKSNDGKIQVELAQLKYIYPRLSGSSKAMSRLAGGIGGRGPGETKLEIDRRRVQNRIGLLEKKLKNISKKRSIRRKKRINSGTTLLSLVGYTNVGKSTILNRLTKSNTIAENKLFATLDTTSRVVVYNNKKMIINDTVGFIKELPNELVKAFMATLEEIKYSNIILHVIDGSDKAYREKMEAVEQILEQFDLKHGEIINIFNKIDKIDKDDLNFIKQIYPNALFISATEDFNGEYFLDKIVNKI